MANMIIERVKLEPEFKLLWLEARKYINSLAKVDLAFNFGHLKKFNYYGPTWKLCRTCNCHTSQILCSTHHCHLVLLACQHIMCLMFFSLKVMWSTYLDASHQWFNRLCVFKKLCTSLKSTLNHFLCFWNFQSNLDDVFLK